MSNYKEKLELIRKFVFGEQTPTPPAPPAEHAKLETQDLKTTDGKVLTVDKLEVGGNVLLDGAAAPDGEYNLENGNVLQVAGGLIVELSTGTEDAIPEETPAEQMAKFTAEVSALRNEFNSHKEAFAAAQSELQKQKEAFGNLLTVVEALAQAPATPPAQAPKKQWHEMSALEKFRASKQN